LQTKFFYNFVALLVYSIDIGLVIMFFQVFEKIEIEILNVLYKTTFC